MWKKAWKGCGTGGGKKSLKNKKGQLLEETRVIHSRHSRKGKKQGLDDSK